MASEATRGHGDRLRMTLLPALLPAIVGFVLFAAAARAQDASVETAEDLAELAGYESALLRGSLGSETSKDLDAYLSDFPNSPRARAVRAEARRRKGRYEDAEEDVAAAFTAPIADAKARIAVATVAFDLHFERGLYDACTADLERGLAGLEEGDREGVPLWSRRIQLLAASGKRKDAYVEFSNRFKDTTRQLEPTPYVLELGRALIALGDLD